MTSEKFLQTKHGTRIAYNQIRGKGPGVIFLGGFMSDKEGSKALALEEYCLSAGRSFVRFDYQGHGASDGAFADGTIGLWAQDALAVLDQLTEGPQILVGSSMGGWISLLLAKVRPGRLAGLVGIAAAPDFTGRHWAELSPDQQQDVLTKGRVYIESDYGPDPYVFTKALFDDGYRNRVLASPLHLDFPVRLIQGTDDPDVPWQTALDIADTIVYGDVDIILVPGGDHRLSEPRDLKRLVETVDLLARR
ncbi:alpha/beta hydrolase [Kordiimonas sediminis]|uniref:Alpha/beta hydrolase n=1 Tax=Kordiimonas sediminis TaxID=1735581 RepID=A0A919AMI5_9PROT|nr:alpha/beta hydrolase [Kordiimonas sediminis]GHF15011.1 alpha/beta hydrolase [Kordiimonas sediminis]